MAHREDTTNAVNLGRHASGCRICSHPDRPQIERDFVNWRSPTAIAKAYRFSDRSTVYRHANAFGLFSKRQRNVRAALEKIIEKAGEVEVTAASVVAAVQAYSKINAQGQWVERNETVNLHELFERMTQDELEVYARDGRLPVWFPRTPPATAHDSQDSLSD